MVVFNGSGSALARKCQILALLLLCVQSCTTVETTRELPTAQSVDLSIGMWENGMKLRGCRCGRSVIV